jgi:hypothetical protein
MNQLEKWHKDGVISLKFPEHAQGEALRAAEELHHRLGVQVMTDEDAVQQIRKMISARDRMARMYAERQGNPLPDWVGKD